MANKKQNAKTFDDKSQPNQKPFPGQTKPDDNFRRQAADTGQEPMPNHDEFEHDDAEVDEHKNIPEAAPKF